MLNDSSNNEFDITTWQSDLVDDAHDLIQVLNIDGILLYVNKAWATTLGYSKAEIEGRSIYHFIDEPDRDGYRTYRHQVITGEIYNKPFVFNLRSKKGHIIPVEGVVRVKKVDGSPRYTCGIFRDITLRLQNELQLQCLNKELIEREQNLQQLLLHAPDAVIVIDQDSRITLWNPKAESLFGWTSEEVMHQPLSNTIIPHQHREAHKKGMQRYLATGKTNVLNRTIEITALNKSGREFYVALTISSTQQGGKTAFIAFLRDITQQKHNQWELEHKTKQLEESNAYLEDFAYAASHDLKEPLRKIRTFADRLSNSLADRLNEDEARLLERMESSAERMQRLVDDLLEFSHVSTRPNGMEEIDLNEKINKIQVDLELLIEEKGARIFAKDLPTIWGNRRQMQQLFFNLINNALKYSKPEVSPLVYITSQLIKGAEAPIDLPPEKREIHFYIIEVRDNGIGFEPEYAEQIFEMFKRLHGKSEYSGTGVGLAIARKVVENHQGFIWATSEPNVGTTFHILLPVLHSASESV